MTTKIKTDELYKFDLYVHTFMITIKSSDGTYHKYMMQGSEKKAKAYGVELARDHHGTAHVKEITLGK